MARAIALRHGGHLALHNVTDGRLCSGLALSYLGIKTVSIP